jgi:hypothetical protein
MIETVTLENGMPKLLMQRDLLQTGSTAAGVTRSETGKNTYTRYEVADISNWHMQM